MIPSVLFNIRIEVPVHYVRASKHSEQRQPETPTSERLQAQRSFQHDVSHRRRNEVRWESPPTRCRKSILCELYAEHHSLDVVAEVDQYNRVVFSSR